MNNAQCVYRHRHRVEKKTKQKTICRHFFGSMEPEDSRQRNREIWISLNCLCFFSWVSLAAAAIAGLELVVEQGVSVIRGSEMLELRLRRVGRAASIAPDHVVLDKEKNIKSMFIVHHDIKLIKSHNVAKNIKFGRHKIWILGYVKIF